MRDKMLSDQETLEIFKKYNKDLYDYYMNNAWSFGLSTRMYAQYLKNKHEKEELSDDTTRI